MKARTLPVIKLRLYLPYTIILYDTTIVVPTAVNYTEHLSGFQLSVCWITMKMCEESNGQIIINNVQFLFHSANFQPNLTIHIQINAKHIFHIFF